jgi:MFS family permease
MRRWMAGHKSSRVMHPKESATTYHFGLVGWLSLPQLISFGSIFYTFTLIMGPVEGELGLTRVESSLAFSLALLAEGLAAHPVGRWIDRGHERAVMTAGSLLAALCLFAHGWIASKAGLYAVWTGLGVAMAAVLHSPVFAVVTRRSPQDFRRAIITMTFLGGLASTVFILFVALWNMGNGMLTIVKGTAMAEYVNRKHVVSLKGALGLPLALAWSAAPLGLGLLWSPQTGYAGGLGILLGLSVLWVAALTAAQKLSDLRPR